jgi:putative colanic acid biosynthesis acetyltransferase WcaF
MNSDQRIPRLVDVAKNRATENWTRREMVGRIIWATVKPLFYLSPRPFWTWRVLLLRFFGAKIGQDVRLHPSVRIEIPWNLSIGDEVGIGDRATLYSLGRIAIGDRSTISQGAHLCAGTHDYNNPAMPLIKSPISIGDEVWVCAEAFIGPNVCVGNHAVVGARAVVMTDVGATTVVAGNPARLIKIRPI